MFLGLAQDFDNNFATPLECFNNERSLVKVDGKFHLISNICPHQQSKISKCATEHLQCPYHGLQFDLTGHGVDNSYVLEQSTVYQYGPLLLSTPLNYDFPVDLGSMQLAEHRTDIVNAPVEVVMDVFLDIDHIPHAHAGVYNQIAISSVDHLTYTTFDQGSIQLVPADDTGHMHQDDVNYNFGACWIALYPGTMIEWQPGALFVTVAHSLSSSACAVEVYKYKDTKYWLEAWSLNEKVWEEAWHQDKELSENIVRLSVENLDSLKQHHRNWINNAV